jgi:hypothetical protein
MSSYLNILAVFAAIFIYYIVLKPHLTLDVIQNGEKYKSYISSRNISLVIFILMNLIAQYFLNVYAIVSKCGGSVSENFATAAPITFLPWTFMLGLVIVSLILFPGFKSCFSDVIGYFYVSTSANNLLSEILIDKDIQNKLDKDSNITKEDKQTMQDVAESIIKICGNTSILINQIVPENYLNYWKILTPLMKKTYQDDSLESTITKKNKLFDIVVTRDNVGESLWFIYTGILVSSLVQMNISSKACQSSPATMEKNYQNFLNKQQEIDSQNQLSTNRTYTRT